MTEDDTFQTLKRPSFDELYKNYFNSNSYSEGKAKVEAANWTWNEFLKEYYKTYGD